MVASRWKLVALALVLLAPLSCQTRQPRTTGAAAPATTPRAGAEGTHHSLSLIGCNVEPASPEHVKVEHTVSWKDGDGTADTIDFACWPFKEDSGSIAVPANGESATYTVGEGAPDTCFYAIRGCNTPYPGPGIIVDGD